MVAYLLLYWLHWTSLHHNFLESTRNPERCHGVKIRGCHWYWSQFRTRVSLPFDNDNWEDLIMK